MITRLRRHQGALAWSLVMIVAPLLSHALGISAPEALAYPLGFVAPASACAWRVLR